MVESADTEVEDNTGVRISMQEASCSQAGENGNEEEMQTDIQDMDEEIAVEPIVKDIAKEFRKVIKCQSKGKGTKKNFKEKDVYYVENLLKKRKNGKKTEYLVQWMGFKNRLLHWQLIMSVFLLLRQC